MLPFLDLIGMLDGQRNGSSSARYLPISPSQTAQRVESQSVQKVLHRSNSALMHVQRLAMRMCARNCNLASRNEMHSPERQLTFSIQIHKGTQIVLDGPVTRTEVDIARDYKDTTRSLHSR